MQEVLAQVKGYLRGAWRFRWYMHMVAWPLCIAGWTFVYYMPDEYEASARVYVDTQSMLRPLLEGLAVQTNFAEQVQVMTRTLLSRPNLEEVVRMTDMDIKLANEGEMETLIKKLQKQIILARGSQENLYTISYTNSNPHLAKEVVQSLLTLFVENSLGDTRQDTNIAQDFLDNQIAEYEGRLSAAEDALKQFKQRNVGLMPEEGRDYYGRLQDLTVQLRTAELELKEATNRRDELGRQLAGEEPVFGIMQSQERELPVTTALDARIQNMENRLDEMLLNYTKEHPDVVALESTIAQLQAEREKKLEEYRKTAPPAVSPIDTNPVYQRLKISHNEAEAEVAVLRVRVAEFKTRVDQLKQQVDSIYNVEAELARLNRDYDINRQNYETLITRRESAKISEQAGQSADNVKFKVIDPPHVPLAPAAPNRLLLVSVVLIGGIAGGILFAFGLSQMRPAFHSARVLSKQLGVPVFGSVSMVWTGKHKFKHQLDVVLFSAAIVGLVIVYGGFLTFQLLFANSV